MVIIEEALLLNSLWLCSLLQGLRNDFKDALDKIDADYLTQLAKQEVSEFTVVRWGNEIKVNGEVIKQVSQVWGGG